MAGAVSLNQPNGSKAIRLPLGVWLGIWVKGSRQNLNIHLINITEKCPILSIKPLGITGYPGILVGVISYNPAFCMEIKFLYLRIL